jgi:hypothetical protein
MSPGSLNRLKLLAAVYRIFDPLTPALSPKGARGLLFIAATTSL